MSRFNPTLSAQASSASAHNTSSDLQASFASHPEQFRFELGKHIAGGAEGDVFDLKLFQLCENGKIEIHDCVAKRIKREKHSGNTIPGEFLLLEELANNMISSAEAGVIRHIGSYRHTDGYYYEIMLKCHFSLEKCFPAIPNLLKTERSEDTALFASVTIKFLTSVIAALSYFSQEKIVHGDMKPDNFLFYKNHFLAADFGSAQHYSDFQVVNQPARGTPLYLAPEILPNERNLPSAADLWAVGQMLRRFLGLELLYNSLKDSESTILAKGSAYREARQKSPKINDNMMIYHQEELCKKIRGYTNFKACLEYLSGILCELLPEKRANLETLRIAFDHLNCLAPPMQNPIGEALFYYNIMNPASVKPVAAPTVSSDTGDWDKFSVDDNIVVAAQPSDSPRVSPIPNQSFPGQGDTGRSPDSDYPPPEELLGTAENCHRFFSFNASVPITPQSLPAAHPGAAAV